MDSTGNDSAAAGDAPLLRGEAELLGESQAGGGEPGDLEKHREGGASESILQKQAKLRAIRHTFSSVSDSLLDVGEADEEGTRFEYKLSTDFVYQNHVRWVKQQPVPGELDEVDHALEFKSQPKEVKMAVAAAHLYGALTTPGAKLMWSRCLDQYSKGPQAVAKALLLDLRIFSIYESEAWNFFIVCVTLGFCVLGCFQLPLTVPAIVWVPLEVLCLISFAVDTVAYARVRRNHFKRGWFVARVLLQLLFVADCVCRLSTDTTIVFALAVRPTYLIARNRDIRIVVTGTMRSVANLALVAVIFVFVCWAALYGYLLFDFCAPEYSLTANASFSPDDPGAVTAFNSSSCVVDSGNWSVADSNFGTFTKSFASLLELLTAPSYLVPLQQPYVVESRVSVVFFLALQILGRFVLLRMVIAVGIHTFKKMILHRQRHRSRKQMQSLNFVFDVLSGLNSDHMTLEQPELPLSNFRSGRFQARATTTGKVVGNSFDRVRSLPPSADQRRFVKADQWMDMFMLMPVCKPKYRRQLGALLWNCTLQMHSGLKPHSPELAEISTSRRQTANLVQTAVLGSPARRRNERKQYQFSSDSTDFTDSISEHSVPLEIDDGMVRMEQFPKGQSGDTDAPEPQLEEDLDRSRCQEEGAALHVEPSKSQSVGLTRKRFFELCGLVGSPYRRLKIEGRAHHRTRMRARSVMSKLGFRLVVDALIAAQLAIFCLEAANEASSVRYTGVFDVFGAVVNCCYVTEIVLKFWAWGPANFFRASKFNALDLIATLSYTVHTLQNLLSASAQTGKVLDWLFVFRAIAILRAVHLLELLFFFKPFYVILTTVQRVVPAINRVLFTLVATFYFTGAIGCHSLSGILNSTSWSEQLEATTWYAYRDVLNFDSLANSIIVHFECATFSQWIIVMEAATVAGGSIVRPFFFTFAFVINLLYVNVLCSFNIHCFMHEYMNLKKELRDAAPLRKQRWEEAGRAARFGVCRCSLMSCLGQNRFRSRSLSVAAPTPKSVLANLRSPRKWKDVCMSLGQWLDKRLFSACCSHHGGGKHDLEFVEYRGLNQVLEGMMDMQQVADSAAELVSVTATAELLKRQLEGEQDRRRATEEALEAMHVHQQCFNVLVALYLTTSP
eukprot:INCI16236.3.p1 GENE.INCI16236.3~~INCI16236.3.p1  ORF type:complete len:1125 (+),score=180.85 INCI16236.3:160-3534(+)